ncbi:dicarboxylate/amino acid:cation symporter [Hyphobacterium marinum]|uniref:Dicarboxylate/amino acid:cation symporter n=1 Tax=Hyphobacterium marinum TaxID=3116574 RepID=A0ABU7LWP3_9PROT|nr:dicarboxylate/amino acid:cation symporter [Hyphobacterium sp. Y6023]MEE2565615.1 dicarboxylate/amino acid:cation symporter [Hyphobacterium sp. Y6023]
MKWWFGVTLWKRVLGALILGIVFGLVIQYTLGDRAVDWLGTYVQPYGDIFIALIRMMIVPLIFTTLVAGVVAMREPARLGSLGLKTIGLYLVTTFFANVIGLVYGTVFRPGANAAEALAGATPEAISQEAPSVWDRILEIIQNPAAAMAEANILAIIFFALLFGVGILMAGEKGQAAGSFFESASEAVLKVTAIVMEFAPFGVFALIAYATAAYGIEAFQSIFWLILTVYLGLFTHVILVYGGLIKVILRLPAIRFFRGIFDAQAVAFSTASSSATLPVTITNATRNLGVKRSVSGSVLPLGATINMDGTALYLGILALFTAQAFGIELSFANYVMIAVTAAVVSIGAAGIPSASLFLLATVLSTFGATPEQIALVVGFILPVDRIMDMARTVVNVTGDAAVAVTVAKSEDQLDEEVFRSPSTI